MDSEELDSSFGSREDEEGGLQRDDGEENAGEDQEFLGTERMSVMIFSKSALRFPCRGGSVNQLGVTPWFRAGSIGFRPGLPFWDARFGSFMPNPHLVWARYFRSLILGPSPRNRNLHGAESLLT